LQDQAHLPNERISLINLNKGKAVVERFLAKIAEEQPSAEQIAPTPASDAS